MRRATRKREDSDYSDSSSSSGSDGNDCNIFANQDGIDFNTNSNDENTLNHEISNNAPTQTAGLYKQMQGFPFSHKQKYTLYNTYTETISQSDTLPPSHLRPPAPTKQQFWWLNANNPSNEDLFVLSQSLMIHPLTLEDIQMHSLHEKCEQYPNYMFMVVKCCGGGLGGRDWSAEKKRINYLAGGVNEGEFEESNGAGGGVGLWLIMGGGWLLTIHFSTIAYVQRVISRLPQRKHEDDATSASGDKSSTITADWILYCLLDEIVDDYHPAIQALQLEVDAIDELILFLSHQEQSDLLTRLGRARKTCTQLTRTLKPKRESIKSLLRKASHQSFYFANTQTKVYFRDVLDHLHAHLHSLDYHAETLTRSHSGYLAQINIELTDASNQMNTVMKKLSAAAALVLPLSLVSGIWGMNVSVPGEPGVERWVQLIPFAVIVAGMGVMMAVMFTVGKRNDWW